MIPHLNRKYKRTNKAKDNQPPKIYPAPGDDYYSHNKGERLLEIRRRKIAAGKAEAVQRKQAIGTLMFFVAALALFLLRLAL